MNRRLRIALVAAAVVLLVPVLGVAGLFVFVPPPTEEFAPEAWRPESALTVAEESRSPAEAVALSQDSLYGPEDVAVDAAGTVYTGDRDGIIHRILADGTAEPFADVGGRPLGLAFDAERHLIVANHGAGLQSVAPDGTVTALADEAAGEPIRFANDLDIASDGRIWFTDSSSRYNTETLGDVPSYLFPDLLDGRASGRLLRYDPTTGATEEVLTDLHFPNGVALSADEESLWIAESTRYRILRYSLADGTAEPLLENVPGIPDGINRDADGSMLVAIYDRTALLDDLVLPTALGRGILARLPNSLFVNEEDPLTGSILVLEPDGSVRHLHTGLEPAGTNVVPHGGQWYLGALLGQPVRTMPAS